MDEVILQITDICKSFGGTPALRGARLDVRAGEVHGLVGENGAGKSTLINIAGGLFPPDSGRMTLCGSPLHLSSPRHAAAQGIAVVHQEAELFAQLSIAENMLLAGGLMRGRLGWINWPATYREAERMLGVLGESFDVRNPAGGLPVARRMMSEIAAAVSDKARVLFLDEPTSSLTVKETENLFEQIRRLRAAGVGIVYVSHRLEEVLALADRVTIMRDGETVDTQSATELSIDRIVATMVGRAIELTGHRRQSTRLGAPRLEIKGATDAQGAFHDVSFSVGAGEIVGLYGFVGAGRSELAQALFGLRRLRAGSVSVDGTVRHVKTPQEAVQAGLAYLPEDRLVQGVFRSHSLRRNASVAMLRRLCTFGWLRGKEECVLADRVVADMAVRATSIEQPIGALSGGNQQKVIFGRWAATKPKALLLDEPTRGVDVGAKAEIHRIIRRLADDGAAIMLISSELPEVRAMSDRVVVLSEGRVKGVFDPVADSEETMAAAAVPAAVLDTAEKRVPRGWDRRTWITRIGQFRELGLVGAIALIMGLMTLLGPDEFATKDNLLQILASAALPAIMAQGAMLIICAGGIDISVGSMLGLVGTVAAMMAVRETSPLVCLALAMLMGAAFSSLNAVTALLARIHPIIVTLAGLSIYRGLMRIVSGGREIMNLPADYRALANGSLLGIPKICYYVVVITLLVHYALRYTLWGRRVLALGNSQNAARLIGLSKARLTLSVFAVSGALVGLTSVLYPCYYGKVQANTGEGMELQAIAAAVIGGTNILGGRGSALGTLLGAFLVALLYNVLILVRISSYWQGLFVGGLILAAVVTDTLLQRSRGPRT